MKEKNPLILLINDKIFIAIAPKLGDKDDWKWRIEPNKERNKRIEFKIKRIEKKKERTKRKNEEILIFSLFSLFPYINRVKFIYLV